MVLPGSRGKLIVKLVKLDFNAPDIKKRLPDVPNSPSHYNKVQDWLLSKENIHVAPQQKSAEISLENVVGETHLGNKNDLTSIDFQNYKSNSLSEKSASYVYQSSSSSYVPETDYSDSSVENLKQKRISDDEKFLTLRNITTEKSQLDGKSICSLEIPCQNKTSELNNLFTTFARSNIGLSNYVADSAEIDHYRNQDGQLNTISAIQTINPNSENVFISEQRNNINKACSTKTNAPSRITEIEKHIQISLEKNKKKRTVCKFCYDSVTNFERHLTRNHHDEKEVLELAKYSTKNAKDKNIRRKLIALLRYETQFQEFAQREHENPKQLPCSYCKRLISVNYLFRHYKTCIVKKPVDKSGKMVQHRIQSHTLLACANEISNTNTTLRILKEVYPKMKADHISYVAKRDPLIRQFGEAYLKKHKRAQIVYACSNKLRECARLLIEIRRRSGMTNISFFDILNPTLFDIVVVSGRTISGYDEKEKNYKAPSLAIHLGTLLKQVCDVCNHVLMKQVPGFRCENIDTKLKEIKRFKLLIESQWNNEVSSLAIKDMAEQKWNRPVALPFTQDVMKFRDYVTGIAEKNVESLKLDQTNEKAYKILVDATLILTILFNKRRIGDVQYLSTASYLKPQPYRDQTEYIEKLSESEKVLTRTYKRVVAGGKGSRPIIILFPKNLQEYINLLLDIRSKTKIIPEENSYLFAHPHVRNDWIRADIVIKKFAKSCNLEHPELISSNRLRKQVATLMQIINLPKEEYTQFARFMGHTEKTHQDYYEITQDAYQTAKVSKLLTLFDKGMGTEYKGKALEAINVEPNMDILEENEEYEPPTTETTTSIKETPNIEEETMDERANSHIPQNNQRIKKDIAGGRVRWTQKQRSVVKSYFKEHIKSKRAPKKEECLKLIATNTNLFSNLDWVRIKTLVYNSYRDKN